MNEARFGSWSAAESPVAVEYSLVVIEEIRHEVAEGFQRLSRGGIEVGGVLYGTHENGTIRVLAIRPVACEHARGPGFILSDKDRVALNEQLVRDRDDPHLEGLVSVGWYLSHTRSEITLADSDLELYSIFFPSPWQVTLVIHPGRAGSMRGGFFIREADGTVKCDHSYREFNFPDRLAGILDAPKSAMERQERDRQDRRERSSLERAPRRVPSVYRADSAAPEPQEMPVDILTDSRDLQFSGSPQLLAPQPSRRKWLWVAGCVIVAAILAVLGLRYWMMHASILYSSEPISLAVLERDGQLRIAWNHAAKPVINATQGTIQIVDGPDSQTFALTPEMLAAGNYTYQRKTGDVEVRMTVTDASGHQVQEASRFLGRPPEAPGSSAELTDLQKRRDDLEAEVSRLRRENDSQAGRIQTLERTLRILQTRLGIDQNK